MVETADAAAVFRWALPLAVDAGRIKLSCFGSQHLFHHQLMLPTIAEIVGVDRFGSDPAQHRRHSGGSLAECHRAAEPSFARIGFPEPLRADPKLMQVGIV